MKKVKTYVGGLLESWDSYKQEEEIDLVRERERGWFDNWCTFMGNVMLAFWACVGRKSLGQ